MRSLAYMKIMDRIRVRREYIVSEIQGRNFGCCRSPTEVMCATWFVRGQIEHMHKELEDMYSKYNSSFTYREYKALDNYVDRLADYYWRLLYDKANTINEKLLEGRVEF